MSTAFGTIGCAVCAGAAMLPVSRAVFVVATTIGTMIWLGVVWYDGLSAVQPLAATCAFLVVLLIRRLRQDHRRAAALLAAERTAHLARINAVAAAERGRIARDLHDGVTHLLTGQLLVLRTAAAALGDGDPALAAERIDHAVGLSRQALLEARDVVEALGGRAPDLELIRATVAAWEDATGRHVTLHLPGHTPAMDGAAWSAVLATLREALTNVARHSAGQGVRVELTEDEAKLELLVVDCALQRPDPGGRGTEGLPAGAGTGLQGLRERAALAGGQLFAGQERTGWHVRLTLPAAGQPTVPAPSR